MEGVNKEDNKEGQTCLSCCHVGEHLQNLNSLLCSRHGNKYSVDGILHHDLQLPHSQSELVVRLVPAELLHV